MDVDNQNTVQENKNAPVDASGQLTQPMKTDVKQMIKS